MDKETCVIENGAPTVANQIAQMRNEIVEIGQSTEVMMELLGIPEKTTPACDAAGDIRAELMQLLAWLIEIRVNLSELHAALE